MSSSEGRLNESQRRLLAELLAGDRSPDDPEVVAAMADETMRTEADRLLAVQESLDRCRDDEEQAVAAAMSFEADVATVAPTIARLAAQEPHAPVAEPRRSQAWRGGLLGLAVVAAAVVIWFVATLPADPDTPDPYSNDDRQLGGGPIVLAAPEPMTDGGLQLSWRSNLRGATFSALVYDPADPLAAPVAERERGPSTTWRLSAQQASAVQDGMRWRVVAHVNGRAIEAEAELR